MGQRSDERFSVVHRHPIEIVDALQERPVGHRRNDLAAGQSPDMEVPVDLRDPANAHAGIEDHGLARNTAVPSCTDTNPCLGLVGRELVALRRLVRFVDEESLFTLTAFEDRPDGLRGLVVSHRQPSPQVPA